MGITSDGEQDPIPGCQHGMSAAAASATQPKLLLADAVSQFDAGDRGRGCRYGLEAVHR